MGAWLLAWVVCTAPGTGGPAPWWVMPVDVVVPVPSALAASQAQQAMAPWAPDMAAFLTGALRHALAQAGAPVAESFAPDVAGPDAVLQAAQQGVPRVVRSEVAQLGGLWAWTATLWDTATAAVVLRATVHGSNASALVAEAEQLARQLMGSKGPPALGFTRAKDRRAFEEHRATHPTWSTAQALQSFLVARNRESDSVAWTEAFLLGSAPLLLTAAGSVVLASFVLGLVVRSPWLSLLGAGLAAQLWTAALVAGAAGLLLVAWDGLDVRHVDVRRSGCCRDDDALEEALASSRAHRAAAWVVALAPSVLGVGTLTGLLATVGVAMAVQLGLNAQPQEVGPQGVFLLPPQPQSQAPGVQALWGVVSVGLGLLQGAVYLSPLVCGVCMAPTLALPWLGVPLGLALWLRPATPTVEEDPQVLP